MAKEIKFLKKEEYLNFLFDIAEKCIASYDIPYYHKEDVVQDAYLWCIEYANRSNKNLPDRKLIECRINSMIEDSIKEDDHIEDCLHSVEYDMFDDVIVEILKKEAIDEVLEDVLTPREKDVLECYFGLYTDEKTCKEIGKKYNMSVARVSQIKNIALRKLLISSRTRSLKSLYGYYVDESVDDDHLIRFHKYLKNREFAEKKKILDEERKRRYEEKVFLNKLETDPMIRFVHINNDSCITVDLSDFNSKYPYNNNVDKILSDIEKYLYGKEYYIRFDDDDTSKNLILKDSFHSLKNSMMCHIIDFILRGNDSKYIGLNEMIAILASLSAVKFKLQLPMYIAEYFVQDYGGEQYIKYSKDCFRNHKATMPRKVISCATEFFENMKSRPDDKNIYLKIDIRFLDDVFPSLVCMNFKDHIGVSTTTKFISSSNPNYSIEFNDWEKIRQESGNDNTTLFDK